MIRLNKATLMQTFTSMVRLNMAGIKGLVISYFLSVVALMPLNVVAEGMYIGGDFSAVTYSQNNLSDFNLNSFGLRFGLDVSKYIGVEARYAFGVGEEDVFVQGQKIGADTAKLSIDSLFGVYLLGKYPLSDSFTPYVLVGQSILRIDDFEDVAESQTNLNGFSYGVGFDSDISESLGFHLEYMFFLDESTADLKGFNVGLRYKL